jgi:hypothetical protein
VKKDHLKGLCPKNYLYENCKCYIIRKYVGDGHSSTNSVLGWSYQQALELYQAVWPRTTGNNKKKDNRLLHILHTPIEFLPHTNHCVKPYAGPRFSLGHLPKGVSMATSTRGERIKQNVGYAIHQNKRKNLEGMGKAMTAVLKHYFNGHTFCGDWCPALFWKDDKRVSKALKYRCKEKPAKLQKQLKTQHDEFVTEEWMLDLMHKKYDSNKPRFFNDFLTKFQLKHKFFASTIVNQGQKYLAVTVVLVLFTLLGLELTETTKEHH